MAGIDISKFKLFEHFTTSKLTDCKIEIIFAVQVNIIHQKLVPTCNSTLG